MYILSFYISFPLLFILYCIIRRTKNASYVPSLHLSFHSVHRIYCILCPVHGKQQQREGEKERQKVCVALLVFVGFVFPYIFFCASIFARSAYSVSNPLCPLVLFRSGYTAFNFPFLQLNYQRALSARLVSQLNAAAAPLYAYFFYLNLSCIQYRICTYNIVA